MDDGLLCMRQSRGEDMRVEMSGQKDGGVPHRGTSTKQRKHVFANIGSAKKISDAPSNSVKAHNGSSAAAIERAKSVVFGCNELAGYRFVRRFVRSLLPSNRS